MVGICAIAWNMFTIYILNLNPHVLSSLIIGDGLGEGYGMLGQAGSGKLRVSMGQSKLAAKVAKKYAFRCWF